MSYQSYSLISITYGFYFELTRAIEGDWRRGLCGPRFGDCREAKGGWFNFCFYKSIIICWLSAPNPREKFWGKIAFEKLWGIKYGYEYGCALYIEFISYDGKGSGLNFYRYYWRNSGLNPDSWIIIGFYCFNYFV